MTTDCANQRIIYTADYGHSIRMGDANLDQHKLKTTELVYSQLSRFRNLAMDYLSGNLFAWDESYEKISVFNINKPGVRYTLQNIGSLNSSLALHFTGLAAHPTLG